MSEPKINNTWMSVTSMEKQIRLDWSNDRHHAVVIDPPYGKHEMVAALRRMAELIEADEYLDS